MMGKICCTGLVGAALSLGGCIPYSPIYWPDCIVTYTSGYDVIVNLTSKPDGAIVWFNGERMGKVPLEIKYRVSYPDNIIREAKSSEGVKVKIDSKTPLYASYAMPPLTIQWPDSSTMTGSPRIRDWHSGDCPWILKGYDVATPQGFTW